MSLGSNPRVSIGLPVYNGEKYLRAAIESIIGQTYQNFELIISDNASHDGTHAICLDCAARDPRIRYFRNSKNLGAAPNYNRTFELSSGAYFKWAAHDDVLDPDFLTKCVAVLEADPEAVLCHCLVEYIDENGKRIGFYDSRLAGADSHDQSVRFGALVLSQHPCNEFFGLIRKEVLSGSLLHGNYHGADRALLSEIALRGRFCRLPEPLLSMREHGDRYTRSMIRQKDRLAWHDSKRKGRIDLPVWRCYSDLLRMVGRDAKTWENRLQCYTHLLRWLFVNWNLARLMVDLLAVFDPEILVWSERLKRKAIGPPPGPLELIERQF